jgi:hypothetical protein
MIRVYINGRIQDINDITITKKLPEIGSLEPSRLSVVVNNANSEYKTDPNTNDIINSYNEVINKDTEIYVEKEVDGVYKRVFTGWIDRPQLNIEKKTLQLQAHDWAAILQKNKLDNRFYVNTTFDTILKDILPASMDKTGIYTITDTIDYVFFENMKVGEAIEKLIKSVGGRFYFDEFNKPIFDGGYKYAETQTTQEFTQTINDIRISSISKIEHSLQDESVDRVTVTSETYKQQAKEDYIYIGENIPCETNPYPLGDDQFIAEFDDPVYYVQPLSQVELQTEDGITIDSTFWDSQFITGTSTPKNPKEMLLKFNGGGTKVVNNETVPQTVDLLKIKGKFLRKETFVNTTGDQSEKANEKEYEPELVQNATWCNKLSQYLYREWHNRPTIQLTLSELQKAKEYKVGKKINLFMDAENIQNRMVIHEIVERYSLNTAKIKLKLKYDAGNSFTPDVKPEITKRPSNQPNIPELEQDAQKDYIGNTPPDTVSSVNVQKGQLWHDTANNQLKRWNGTGWDIIRENYKLGLLRVEGDNLYAGEIKSNALLPDGSPVSKINLDDGTFKFGDDVSATPKYISYDGNTVLLKGGTLELSSDAGEINFIDSGWLFRDIGTFSFHKNLAKIISLQNNSGAGFELLEYRNLQYSVNNVEYVSNGLLISESSNISQTFNLSFNFANSEGKIFLQAVKQYQSNNIITSKVSTNLSTQLYKNIGTDNIGGISGISFDITGGNKYVRTTINSSITKESIGGITSFGSVLNIQPVSDGLPIVAQNGDIVIYNNNIYFYSNGQWYTTGASPV